jgi:hypothetical protein
VVQHNSMYHFLVPMGWILRASRENLERLHPDARPSTPAVFLGTREVRKVGDTHCVNPRDRHHGAWLQMEKSQKTSFGKRSHCNGSIIMPERLRSLVPETWPEKLSRACSSYVHQKSGWVLVLSFLTRCRTLRILYSNV